MRPGRRPLKDLLPVTLVLGYFLWDTKKELAKERTVQEGMERDIEGLDNSDLLAARAEARALLAGADRLRSFSHELAN